MGLYTNWDQVCGRYPDAAKRGGATEMENYFITGAEAEIDGRIGRRYTVPMTPAPELVKSVATDLTWFYANRFAKGMETFKEQIDATLDGIADGSIVLVVSGTNLTQGNYASAENSYHSVFGPDDPINWQVSSEQLYQARVDRGGY